MSRWLVAFLSGQPAHAGDAKQQAGPVDAGHAAERASGNARKAARAADRQALDTLAADAWTDGRRQRSTETRPSVFRRNGGSMPSRSGTATMDTGPCSARVNTLFRRPLRLPNGEDQP